MILHYLHVLVVALGVAYVLHEAARPVSKRVARYRSRVRFQRVYQARLRYLQLRTAQVGDLVEAITGRRTLVAEWDGSRKVSLRKLRWDDFVHDVARA